MVTEQHVAWLNDPAVVRFSEQRHKTHTLESQHQYLNEFPVGSHIWLVVAKPPPEADDEGVSGIPPRHIGTITAYIDPHNRVANMGIMIGEKSLWGQGYGSEAWDAVIDWLFAYDKIRKIECGCMHKNFSMRQLAEKAGMHQEGGRNEHFWHEGAPAHLVMFGLMWYDMYHARTSAEPVS